MLRTITKIMLGVALGVAAAMSSLPASAMVFGSAGPNPARQFGMSPGGQMLLFSPDPLQPGSSLSHWDTSASPNLLMEPALSPDLPFLGLDITPDQMQDVGWSSGASTFNIYPLDPPGTGFTDPTPFPGAPGNPATTLGEARTNLFNAVLGVWAGTLQSAVNVDVLVIWTPLFCQEGAGAVLAAAGTTEVFLDSTGTILPHADVWYHAALAESLAGADLTGPVMPDSGGDIIVFMNSEIDNGCLGAGTGYYYGLDGIEPPNQLDVSSVLLHELAHGLGFSNFINEADGANFMGYPGVYDLFTYDTVVNKSWDQMTDAERVASATRFRKVVWTGGNTNTAAAGLLSPGMPDLQITAPAAISGNYEIGTASFGPPLPAGRLTGEIACMVDESPYILDGCSSANTVASPLAGKIALIERGQCAFTQKVANAQAAGAIGAIIINLSGNSPVNLGGSDPAITIPALSVGMADGYVIAGEGCPGYLAARYQPPPVPTLSIWSLLGLSLLVVAAGLFWMRRRTLGTL